MIFIAIIAFAAGIAVERLVFNQPRTTPASDTAAVTHSILDEARGEDSEESPASGGRGRQTESGEQASHHPKRTLDQLLVLAGEQGDVHGVLDAYSPSELTDLLDGLEALGQRDPEARH